MNHLKRERCTTMCIQCINVCTTAAAADNSLARAFGILIRFSNSYTHTVAPGARGVCARNKSPAQTIYIAGEISSFP